MPRGSISYARQKIRRRASEFSDFMRANQMTSLGFVVDNLTADIRAIGRSIFLEEVMARTQSLNALHREIRQLQAKAKKLEQAEKPGIKQLRSLLKKYKLGLADVKGALNGAAPTGRRSKLTGRKVKPKYRNPERRSETWTGRGRMPLWMAALVKKGKKPDDFLIKG